MSLSPIPNAEVQHLMADADEDALVDAFVALDDALGRAQARLGALAAEAAERRAKRQATRPGTGQLVGSQGLKRESGTGRLKLAEGQARPARPATAPMGKGPQSSPLGAARGPKRPRPQTADPLARYGKAGGDAADRLIAAVEAAERQETAPLDGIVKDASNP